MSQRVGQAPERPDLPLTAVGSPRTGRSVGSTGPRSTRKTAAACRDPDRVPVPNSCRPRGTAAFSYHLDAVEGGLGQRSGWCARRSLRAVADSDWTAESGNTGRASPSSTRHVRTFGPPDAMPCQSWNCPVRPLGVAPLRCRPMLERRSERPDRPSDRMRASTWVNNPTTPARLGDLEGQTLGDPASGGGPRLTERTMR